MKRTRIARLFLALCLVLLLVPAANGRAASKKDTKKPTVKTTLSTEKHTNGSIKITVKATDAGGISSVKWASGSKDSAYFKKSGTKLTLSKGSAKVTIKKNGTYSFYAKDKSGNVTIKKVKVSNIDKTAPTLTLTPSTKDATNGTVKITAKVSDQDAGISTVYYLSGNKTAAQVKKDGSKLTVKSGKASKTVKKNGTYSFLAVDKAGNETLKTIKISNIDTAAPKVSATYSVMNQSGTVTVRASDEGSGIASLKYLSKKVSDPEASGWKDAKTIKNNTFTIKKDGNYSILATDKAGNKAVYVMSAELELKAVWISYLEFYEGSSSGYTEKTFKKQVDAMFDEAKDLNMNAVIVQVRPFADAMYESDYFPWSSLLTGTQGKDPGYDPMEYMIEAAHSRGLQFHAWLNPYRVTDNSFVKNTKMSKDNQARIWLEEDSRNVLEFGGRYYYNPSSKEVQTLIVNGVREIVEKYDVDGIHLDDYFYPSLGSSYKSVFDAEEYDAYKEKTGSSAKSIIQWRRDNVNTLVKKLYAAVKEENSEAVFGISPAGNISNLYSSSGHYVDVKTWMSSDNYVDYICPQIYWEFGHSTCPYDETVDEWLKYRTSSTVNVYVGIATYKAGDSAAGSAWGKASDMLSRQVEYGRDTGKVDGYMFFRLNSFKRNCAQDEVANLVDTLK